MQRLLRPTARLAVLLTMLLCLNALLAGVASAHARLVSSTPADGAVLTSEPATVSAVYAEDTALTASQFEVYYAPQAAGTPTRADNGDGHVDVNQRTHMSTTLKPGLGDGVYTVKWHTVTEDDNGQLDGTFSFRVAGGSPPPPPTAGSTGGGTAGSTGNSPSGGAGSGLPATGNPLSILPPLGLLALLTAGFGAALRRRALR